MNKLKLTSIVLGSIFFSFFFQKNAAAQHADTVYVLGNGYNFMTLEEINELVAEKKKRIEGRNEDLTVSYEVYDERVVSDTLYRYGSIAFKGLSISSDDEKITNQLNQKMPAFEFEDIEGKKIKSEDLEGKVILINFWFTRCAPCIAEMPYLSDIKNESKDENVVFLSMAPENTNQVKKFLKKHPFNFTHLPDADDFLKNFGIGFPKNILIDKKGKIRFVGQGLVGEFATKDPQEIEDSIQRNIDQLENKITDLLNE